MSFGGGKELGRRFYLSPLPTETKQRRILQSLKATSYHLGALCWHTAVRGGSCPSHPNATLWQGKDVLRYRWGNKEQGVGHSSALLAHCAGVILRGPKARQTQAKKQPPSSCHCGWIQWRVRPLLLLSPHSFPDALAGFI